MNGRKRGQYIEPKTYEDINNKDVTKFAQIKFNSATCSCKHGRKIIGKFGVSDIYANGILDLGQFFQRFETQAGALKTSLFKISPSEKIFESVSPNEFKTKGNKILKIIRVALLQKATIMDKNHTSEIKEIMTKYYNDPIEGGHMYSDENKKIFLLATNDKSYF